MGSQGFQAPLTLSLEPSPSRFQGFKLHARSLEALRHQRVSRFLASLNALRGLAAAGVLRGFRVLAVELGADSQSEPELTGLPGSQLCDKEPGSLGSLVLGTSAWWSHGP